MKGKICVITGATSGIGLAAAHQIAALGPARLLLVGRDKARSEAAAEAIRRAAPQAGSVELFYADLSLMAEIRRLASDIAQSTDRIDVLVNNAGAAFGKRHVTSENLERTFALNHMSYFLLTNLLLDRLKAAGSARIISTTSGAHKGGKIDFDDLQLENKYSTFRAYSGSKLANILFTRELARRLEGTGMTANAFDPGVTATRFASEMGFVMRSIFGVVKHFAQSAEEAAKTITMLASDPSVAKTSGKLFAKGKEIPAAPVALDEAVARRLWDVSSQIAGLAGSDA